MNGERHRPTAKKLAQLFWSEVIKLEATYRASDRYSPEKAELWNEALRTEDAPVSIRDLIYEEVQKAPKEHRKAFSKVALATTPTLTQAVPAYLKAREEGNGYGYAPLAASTVADINSAIAHLSRFLKQPPEAIYLGDLNKDNMLTFRGEYLPSQISKRTGEGLAPATIGKMITMLRGLWYWGQEHRGLPEGATPFDLPKGVRRERPKAKRWSQEFGPVVKMDRLIRKTIHNEETKEPFCPLPGSGLLLQTMRGGFQGQGCA